MILSRNSLGQPKINHIRSLTTVFYCTPHLFKCCQQKAQNFLSDWSKFNRKEFIATDCNKYFAADWPHILKHQNNTINTFFQTFLHSMRKIFDKHAVLRKLSKYDFKSWITSKYNFKFWITTALQKLFFIYNKIFKDFINKTDVTQKTELPCKYKSYKNILPTLTKKSKQNYFPKFFENNLNNLKKTWKGIKSTISLKSFISFPKVIHLSKRKYW